VELSWSVLTATSIDPSARTLWVLGRDDILTGLGSRALHHFTSRPRVYRRRSNGLLAASDPDPDNRVAIAIGIAIAIEKPGEI